MSRFPFEYKKHIPQTAYALKREGNTLFLEDQREVSAFVVSTGLEDDFYRVEPTSIMPALRIVYKREIDAADAEKAVRERLDVEDNLRSQ